MKKQSDYISLTNLCLHIRKMDSDTDFSSDTNYDEFANEVLFDGYIPQPFQFELVFTATEIQAKKHLAGTSA